MLFMDKILQFNKFDYSFSFKFIKNGVIQFVSFKDLVLQFKTSPYSKL